MHPGCRSRRRCASVSEAAQVHRIRRRRSPVRVSLTGALGERADTDREGAGMKRRLIVLAAVAAAGAVGVGALQAATPNVQVGGGATKSQTVLREKNAAKLADKALQSCADKGF